MVESYSTEPKGSTWVGGWVGGFKEWGDGWAEGWVEGWVDGWEEGMGGRRNGWIGGRRVRVERWAESEDGWVSFNINDMYNNDVVKGGARVYEAYEVK
jgi:hypothetical protein